MDLFFLFGHLQMLLLPLKKLGRSDRSCQDKLVVCALFFHLSASVSLTWAVSPKRRPSKYQDQIRKVNKHVDFFFLFVSIERPHYGLLKGLVTWPIFIQLALQIPLRREEFAISMYSFWLLPAITFRLMSYHTFML
ncbi:hypothetical protein KC19_12G049500 [Ceratodon purpureus]|uniref:Uncharacterized protein n=1 Tax=Ceratodon purpureus TaxID=3225 RepID=A0A8T0G7S1_CERPU|nr:hypothetical protein KC19_12G049500 [Ceratodon purpureus]